MASVPGNRGNIFSSISYVEVCKHDAKGEANGYVFDLKMLVSVAAVEKSFLNAGSQ